MLQSCTMLRQLSDSVTGKYIYSLSLFYEIPTAAPPPSDVNASIIIATVPFLSDREFHVRNHGDSGVVRPTFGGRKGVWEQVKTLCHHYETLHITIILPAITHRCTSLSAEPTGVQLRTRGALRQNVTQTLNAITQMLGGKAVCRTWHVS